MTKREMFKELEMVRERILELDETAKIDVSAYDEITEKDSQSEIKKALSQAKKDLKKLESEIDTEIEKALEKDGKKAVFKWATLDGYYKIKLATVTPENVKKNWKISFRLDTKKIEKINDYFYYNNPEKSDFSSIDFENGQDIATVKSIGKDGIIKAESDKNGGIWWIYPEDINGSKSTKCVLKDGSNIAFLVYAPIEK